MGNLAGVLLPNRCHPLPLKLEPLGGKVLRLTSRYIELRPLKSTPEFDPSTNGLRQQSNTFSKKPRQGGN